MCGRPVTWPHTNRKRRSLQTEVIFFLSSPPNVILLIGPWLYICDNTKRAGNGSVNDAKCNTDVTVDFFQGSQIGMADVIDPLLGVGLTHPTGPVFSIDPLSLPLYLKTLWFLLQTMDDGLWYGMTLPYLKTLIPYSYIICGLTQEVE